MSNDSTPGGFLPPDFNAIPLQLKSLDQWFLWRAEAKPGEPSKFKKRPRNLKGVAASKTNPSQMSDFDSARKTFEESEGRFTGVGISLLRNGIQSGERVLICIDLDNVRNAETGELVPWAEKLIRYIDSYTEASPSGKGIHIWAYGEHPPANRNRDLDGVEGQRVEFYSGGAFLTVTGCPIGKAQYVVDRTDALKRLYARLGTEHESPLSGQDTYFGKFAQVDLSSLPISEQTKQLIREGKPVGQRSEAIYSVICTMVNAGISNAIIASVLTDSRYKIGDKALSERHGNRASAAEWLLPQIEKARATSPKPGTHHLHTGGGVLAEPPAWTTELEHQVSSAPAADKQPFPDPLPLAREETKPEPYPVHALGEVLGEAAESIHRIAKLPLAIAAQSVLSASNLITQAKANVAIDGRTIPLSLFLLAIALSGERKSEADRVAMYPVDTWQKRRYARYQRDFAQYEQKLERWVKSKRDEAKPPSPIAPMIKCEEPTIQGIYKLLSEGLGLVGILSDEGGQLLGGYAMSKDHALETITRLSKLWDGKPLDRIRGTDALTLLYDRRANLHLMLQPGIADKLLCHDEAKSQGFLNRCLVCHPESMFGSRPYQAIDPSEDSAIQRYWSRMKALMDEGVNHGEGGGLLFQALALTPEAKSLWVQFHDTIDQHITIGGPLRPIAGAAAKGAEQSLRIAGTLALFDGLGEIDLDHMRSGIKLADFYLSEMLRLHEGATVSKEISEAQKLLDWIRQWTKEKGRKVVCLEEIYRLGPYSLRTAKAARAVVAELVNHRYLFQHDPVEIDGRNRREVWLLWEGKQ